MDDVDGNDDHDDEVIIDYNLKRFHLIFLQYLDECKKFHIQIESICMFFCVCLHNNYFVTDEMPFKWFH